MHHGKELKIVNFNKHILDLETWMLSVERNIFLAKGAPDKPCNHKPQERRREVNDDRIQVPAPGPVHVYCMSN